MEYKNCMQRKKYLLNEAIMETMGIFTLIQFITLYSFEQFLLFFIEELLLLVLLSRNIVRTYTYNRLRLYGKVTFIDYRKLHICFDRYGTRGAKLYGCTATCSVDGRKYYGHCLLGTGECAKELFIHILENNEIPVISDNSHDGYIMLNELNIVKGNILPENRKQEELLILGMWLIRYVFLPLGYLLIK